MLKLTTAVTLTALLAAQPDPGILPGWEIRPATLQHPERWRASMTICCILESPYSVTNVEQPVAIMRNAVVSSSGKRLKTDGPPQESNREWVRTEMSVYDRGAQTRRHVCTWGTRNVFGHPDPRLVGHWIRVGVLATGHEFVGVVVGRMGHVKPSRHSRCPRRVLDIAVVGWRQQFGRRPLGVIDVEYSDLGKSPANAANDENGTTMSGE